MLKQEEIKKLVADGKDIYLIVVYCKDGGIHLMPEASKEDAWKDLLKMRRDPATCNRMAATTISKRSAASFGDGKIFGAPKSLDVMQLTDKQFINACAAADIASCEPDPDEDPGEY